MTDDHWLSSVFGKEFHRSEKPRTTGLTMVLDKGLSRDQFEGLMDTGSEFIDQIKFPYGTVVFYEEELVERKLQISRKHDISVYPGGTLFEVAHRAGSTNEYFNALLEMGFEAVEISSGSIDLAPEIRGELIARASQRGLTVVAEVGKKDPDRQPDPGAMCRQVKRDFDNGADYVTIESRESGKGIGIYDDRGNVVEERLDTLVDPLDNLDRIIWEAPLTNQQGYLIRRFGCDVNLGNIPSGDLLSLESLRWGLRWETVEEPSSPLTQVSPKA